MGYPTNSLKIKQINDKYFKSIELLLPNQIQINNVLNKILMTDGSKLTCKKLLTAPFNELSNLSQQINQLSDLEKTQISPLSNYEKGQPLVAKFFMEQLDVNLSSCFYCNIDSIYVFSKLADYWGPLDFIQRADLDQLQLIDFIGIKKAQKILKQRTEKQFEELKDLPVSSNILDKIQKMEYNSTHNHFTLDHFHHQANYKFLSLCLYNFVPCCYVCNSKFKKALKLYNKNPELSSPSSNLFTFHNDVKFKVYFADTTSEKFNTLNFAVDLEISNNKDSHIIYLNVLRIRGRYLHHKREALRLLKLKADYPQSRLQELSESLKLSIDEVKRLVFGAELFDKQYDNSSLIKYKRDVAKNIKILD